MSVTRILLRQDIIKRLYAPRKTLSETTAGASANTVIDDTLFFPSTELEDFMGSWIYIVEDNDPGPEIGEVSRVIYSSSGDRVVVSPPFTASTATSTDYEIHYKFHPEDINDVIDDIIRVGTRGALGALASDTSTTTLERDIVVDGALSILKRHLAVGKNQMEAEHLNEEAQFHEDRFRAGILRSGYPPLEEF